MFCAECVDSITENRTKEVSNFLSMLRSVSVDGEESKLGDSSHRSWKVCVYFRDEVLVFSCVIPCCEGGPGGKIVR